MNILQWIKMSLIAVGFFGIFVGALSLMFPKRSIQFYQWIMKHFNWRVEPIDYNRELRNTRALGLWLLATSILVFVVLFRPESALMNGLRG